jgi:hypothetical protein
MQLGMISTEQEQWPQGIQEYISALDYLRPAGDSHMLAEAEYSLALVLEFNGDVQGAIERIAETQRIVTGLNGPVVEESIEGKERAVDAVSGEFVEMFADLSVKMSELVEKLMKVVEGVSCVVDSSGRIEESRVIDLLQSAAAMQFASGLFSLEPVQSSLLAESLDLAKFLLTKVSPIII